MNIHTLHFMNLVFICINSFVAYCVHLFICYLLKLQIVHLLIWTVELATSLESEAISLERLTEYSSVKSEVETVWLCSHLSFLGVV